MSEAALPVVTCLGCGRQVECMRVKDGTVYRPTGWRYPDPNEPLRGECGACHRYATEEDLKIAPIRIDPGSDEAILRQCDEHITTLLLGRYATVDGLVYHDERTRAVPHG